MKEKIIKIIFFASTLIGILVAISILSEVMKENQELAEIENSISELKEMVISSNERIEVEKNVSILAVCIHMHLMCVWFSSQAR